MASYVSDVGEQVTLRYLSNAVETTQALGTWRKASDEAKAVAVQQEQATKLSAAASQPWQPGPMTAGSRLGTRITYYDCDTSGFCGNMASGIPVSDGFAACSYNMPFGTKFRIEGDPTSRVWTCGDRGLLSSTHVDVWFYHWSDGSAYQSLVGSYGTITIIG